MPILKIQNFKDWLIVFFSFLSFFFFIVENVSISNFRVFAMRGENDVFETVNVKSILTGF